LSMAALRGYQPISQPFDQYSVGHAAGLAKRRPPARRVTLERIVESRILIDPARLPTVRAANVMDTVGQQGSAADIAMSKIAAPNMVCQVVDRAIQAFGGRRY
jgi:alkylation response protein AidB-like acyl-CoA dehydrogenase